MGRMSWSALFATCLGGLGLVLPIACAGTPTAGGEVDAATTDESDDAAAPPDLTPLALDGAAATTDRAPEMPFGAALDGQLPDMGGPMLVEGGPHWSGPSMPVTVTVVRGVALGHLPAGFAGFSYEKSHLTDGFFTSSNAPLVALFKLLGPGVLRIGGNAVDRTTWQPNAAPAAAGKVATTVGTAEVDALAGFLTATGWRALYGVDMKISTPADAVAEATYASQTLGDSLYALEIGNEISNYGSYATNRPRWDTFARAIHAALPAALVTGPGCYGGVNAWAVPFARDEASLLVQLTQHFYLGSGKSGAATMAKMLGSRDAAVTLAKTLQVAATTNHVRDGFRFSEANSFFNHGAPGVSDTLGAALWSIDFMLTSAQNGAAGVNFHGGGPGQDGPAGFTYTPIDETTSKVTGAKPVYYGMLLVAQAGTGDLLTTSTQAGSLNVEAFAVALADGGTNLVVVNADAATGLALTVDLGGPAGAATAIYLLGPKIDATTGLTLAGAAVSPAGEWSPQPPYAVHAAGGKLTLVVPAASAVLVRAR
jgi:hypothetical protein